MTNKHESSSSPERGSSPTSLQGEAGFDINSLVPSMPETELAFYTLIDDLKAFAINPRLTHVHVTDIEEVKNEYSCDEEGPHCYRLGSYFIDFPEESSMRKRELLVHIADANEAMAQEMTAGFSILSVDIKPSNGLPSLHYIKFADGREELEVEDSHPTIQREVIVPKELNASDAGLNVGVRGSPEFMQSFTQGLEDYREKRRLGMLKPTEASMQLLIKYLSHYKKLLSV